MTPPIAPPTAGPTWDAPSLSTPLEVFVGDVSVVSIEEVTGELVIAPPTAGLTWDAPSLSTPLEVFVDDISVVSIEEVTGELVMPMEDNVGVSVVGCITGVVLEVGVVDMLPMSEDIVGMSVVG